jgi:hypothetical protein
MAFRFNFRAAVRTALMAACICTAFVSSAGAGAPQNGQIVLTKESVARWLKAYPDMRALVIRIAAAKGTSLAKVKDPLEAVMTLASDQAAQAEANATVKAHGFKDFNEWLTVSYSAALAYGRLKSDANAANAAKMNKKINDLPFLTDKQKRKLAEEAQKQMGDGGALAPLPENVEIVRGMEKSIDTQVAKGLK